MVAQLLLGGGTTPAQDLANFMKRSPNLIVATPGRLLELLSSQHVHCPQSAFEVLIMDEADRLLDLGFQDTLQRILTRLPKQRRTGLFSASMSEAVDQLIRVGLRNPVRVAVRVRSTTGAQDKRTPASLRMHYITTTPTQRWPAMHQLLSKLDPQPQKSLIYLSTCAAVDYWQHVLPAILPQQYTIIPLHGKHQPNVRTKNFAKFLNTSSPSILLTTDVAARGLDVPAVDLVIQLDPPSDPKTFIHRCGRAGRAGRKGLAVILLNAGKETDYIEFLRIRGTPITALPDPAVTFPGVDSNSSSSSSNARNDPETSTSATIREIVRTDRAIHDKAQRAFVSWVRSYRAHHATSSIFSVQDLDWVAQAHGWGLLRLPKMPELKGLEIDRGLGLVGGVELGDVTYRDPVREAKRVAELAEFTARMERGEMRRPKREHLTEEAKKARAWSRKKDVKSVKEVRRTKKEELREKARIAALNVDERVEEDRLQAMIAEVRRRGEQESMMTEEFQGFD